MADSFNGQMAQRWLSGQFPDVQDLLGNYAKVTCTGLGIALHFEMLEFAQAAQLQSHRFVQPAGLPPLQVTFIVGNRQVLNQGTGPTPPATQA